MKTVICYKCVPDNEGIGIRADRTLDTGSAVYSIGQYDLNAVEAGIQLAGEDDEVVVLTAGGAVVDNSKLKKAVLARGPKEMYGIMDESLGTADTLAIAKMLKAGIQKIGGVDLVICGEGSGDMYVQQVGNMLGSLLGWNTVNSVCGVTAEDGHLKVERFLEDGVEVLEVDLPAVISVTGDINTPRIASLKDIMGAGKKPSTIWSLSDLAAKTDKVSELISVLAPEETDRKKIVIEGSGDEAVSEFVEHLKKAL